MVYTPYWAKPDWITISNTTKWAAEDGHHVRGLGGSAFYDTKAMEVAVKWWNYFYNPAPSRWPHEIDPAVWCAWVHLVDESMHEADWDGEDWSPELEQWTRGYLDALHSILQCNRYTIQFPPFSWEDTSDWAEEEE